MDDSFLEYIGAWRYKYIYGVRFSEITERIESSLSTFCAVIGSASIAAWAFWKEYAIVWAVLVGLTQLIQTIRPYMPFRDRIIRLKRALPELASILNDMEDDWDRYQMNSDAKPEECGLLLIKYRRLLLQLSERSAFESSTPVYKCVRKRAEEEYEQHCSLFYKTKEWRQVDAGTSTNTPNA
jgi:hypothetical protein